MLTINTNLSSLIAQSSMKQSTDKLNQAIERMTTGFKINHASDNAANYSISTNMTTKIGAYNIAEDNASMGLDMLTTASEGLSLIEDKLSRLRALATQSSNGTYGTQSKDAINAEANAIVDEIERLYSTSEYNGLKLFESEKTTVSMPKAGADGFIKTVEKQDTTSLTKLSEVSSSADLADGTYSISTAEELAQLAQMTNAGYISEGDTFILANNIDLAQWCADHAGEGGWTPIGDNTNRFLGTFDGNGYKISNLKINRNGQNFQGLFGRTDGNSVIKNLGVINVDITSDMNCTGAIVGGVINGSNTLIDNSYSTGKIYGGGQCIGGIFGQGGSITNSYSTCSVSSTGNASGGLAGLVVADSIIKNCYATANVTSDGNNCGGLIGQATGNNIIENCYATGNVTSDGNNCGGLIGYSGSNGNIKNCYATGNVTSKSIDYSQAGGLVGQFKGATISNCFATGNVTGSSNHVGGLVGVVYNTTAIIDSCYATGNVNGAGSVGGFLGTTSGSTLTITNSYCTGNVTGSEDNIGGFAGYVESTSTAVFENCYTKSSTTGSVESVGFLGYMGGTSNVTMRNCSILGDISNVDAIFLARNNSANKGVLTIEDCRYNSELISSTKPLVVASTGTTEIIEESMRSEITTCGFITPFDFSSDIKVGLQVGIDSTQNSRIDLTMNFGLDYLSTLRQIGKTDADLYKAIDSMLNTISTKQTEFGAVQNRLESVLEEITIQRDNLISSRSTIRDADIAEVSSHYIQQQILQQASATLLATANQSPSIALQLI